MSLGRGTARTRSSWSSDVLRRFAVPVLVALVIAACTSAASDTSPGAPVSTGPAGQITLHADQVTQTFDRRLLGTNVPAWLRPDLVRDPVFTAELSASGTTLLRLPGGSWSSDYDWLGCELADPDSCYWTWAMRPSDFVELLQQTDLAGMWTVSFNGTAEEAAAAVAFFNGSVDDTRPIGTDRHGRDWLTVGDWARLRADDGHPEPAGIRYWEVGNEVYGAVSGAGPQCAAWGWEQVWTCDGADYVSGTAEHDGYLSFQAAMKDVDPSIEVGAVGVGDRGEWSDWDRKVIGGAGDAIDFYVIHTYGSDGDVPADQVLALPASRWPSITEDVAATFEENGLAPAPIAVTEHNLVAFADGDEERLMTTSLNAFYLAESIGEMAKAGVSIANQWNFANGRAANGTDYGLIDATTHDRSPAYYALALWSRFGDRLVTTDQGAGLEALVVYGGLAEDGTARLLVLNPSDRSVPATVTTQPTTGPATVTVDELVTPSLDSTEISFNGSSSPSIDLDEPGETATTGPDGELAHDFPARSISVLSWGPHA